MTEKTSRSRHVFITGCSTGIGRACALHLARCGFSVLATVRKQEDGAELQGAAGSGLRAMVMDVTDAISISAAAEEVRGIVGEQGLCGLVNNAGIGVFGPLEFITIDDWRRQFEVNVFGQVAVTQAMLPLLRQCVSAGGRGGGWADIIMMGSVAGKISQPIASPYAASKHAIEAISDAMRAELRDQAIHICLIEPGAIQSEIWRKVDEAATAFSPESPVGQRYGGMINGVLQAARKAAAGAVPAERVAKVVERCLRRRRPPTRVVVGRDAKVGAFFKWLLPDRWFDAILRKAFGI